VGYIVFRNFVKVVHYAVQKLFSRHDSGLGNAFAVNKSELLLDHRCIMNCKYW
jgi:hypothetical protein